MISVEKKVYRKVIHLIKEHALSFFGKYIKYSIKFFLVYFLASASMLAIANDHEVALDKAPLNPNDKASLQRGAAIFMNKCASCHSLGYVRYKSLAQGIGMTDAQGDVFEDIVQENLNFISDSVNDNIVSSMNPKLAEKWFGVTPPDLSLVTRSRGSDWLYTYLRGFYKDNSRPFGVNNTVFPDVGMPHVLLDEQGVVEPVYSSKEGKKVEELVLVKEGTLGSKANYDRMVADLVNFLDYVGEPVKQERKRMGVFVLLFLLVLTVFTYLLKREYWKEVYADNRQPVDNPDKSEEDK